MSSVDRALPTCPNVSSSDGLSAGHQERARSLPQPHLLPYLNCWDPDFLWSQLLQGPETSPFIFWLPKAWPLMWGSVSLLLHFWVVSLWLCYSLNFSLSFWCKVGTCNWLHSWQTVERSRSWRGKDSNWISPPESGSWAGTGLRGNSQNQVTKGRTVMS